jgi:hypothetical protein
VVKCLPRAGKPIPSQISDTFRQKIPQRHTNRLETERIFWVINIKQKLESRVLVTIGSSPIAFITGQPQPEQIFEKDDWREIVVALIIIDSLCDTF